MPKQWIAVCCLWFLLQPAWACDISREFPQGVQVLIATDHTLPAHYGEASAGAEGRERDYIDPSARVFAHALVEAGVTVYLLRVEDQLCDGQVTDAESFRRAYSAYDSLLQQAVEHGVTIVALHFDADRLPPEAPLAEAHYIGGVQIIVDPRAKSEGTRLLTDYLLHEVKLLEQMASTGLRLRPGYETQLREQNNQTLHIAGHSRGGALLLELGSQRQARELFGEPEQVAAALKPSLELLARSIVQWRIHQQFPNR